MRKVPRPRQKRCAKVTILHTITATAPRSNAQRRRAGLTSRFVYYSASPRGAVHRGPPERRDVRTEPDASRLRHPRRRLEQGATLEALVAGRRNTQTTSLPLSAGLCHHGFKRRPAQILAQNRRGNRGREAVPCASGCVTLSRKRRQQQGVATAWCLWADFLSCRGAHRDVDLSRRDAAVYELRGEVNQNL